MSGTITAISAAIQMCLVGMIGADHTCHDGQAPFAATMNVLSGEMYEGCQPDFTTKDGWTKCVARWTAVLEIKRGEETIFIIHPDGRLEARDGFALDEAARAFWEAMARAAPSLDIRGDR